MKLEIRRIESARLTKFCNLNGCDS